MTVLPTYVGSGSVGTGTGSIGSGEGLSIHGSTAANDILFLIVNNCNTTTTAATLSDAQGFTAVGSGAIDSGSFGGIHCYSTLFWKRATGSDSVPTVADNGEQNAARIDTFRGCIRAGNPWNAISSTGDTDGDNNLTVAGATTSIANSLVAIFFQGFNGGAVASSVSGYTNADLANITERADASFTVSTEGLQLVMATGEKATASSYTTTTATWGGGAPYHVTSAITIALTPEPDVSYVPPSRTPRVLPPVTRPGSFAFVGPMSPAPPGVGALTRPALPVPPIRRAFLDRTAFPPVQPIVPPVSSFLPVRFSPMPRRDPGRHPRGRFVRPPLVIADVVVPPVGGAGAATFAINVEDGATITYEWLTNVRPSWNGIETRASLIRTPRQRFDFNSILGDAQHRSLLGTLASLAVDAPLFLLGLPHEELGVVSSTSSAIVVQSLAECDWAVAGQRIVVIGRDGITTASTWISAPPVGASIQVGSDVSAVALAGARVMPAIGVYLDPEQGLSRHRVNIGEHQLVAMAAQNGYGATTQWGVGATVTTHDSMPVWDRGNALGVASQPLLTGASMVDAGLGVSAIGWMDAPHWRRTFRIESSDSAEWQWLKAMLMQLRGRHTAFLLPTGRPDLIPVGDASSGTLTISGANYVSHWFPSLAHRRIKLVKTDGSVGYRTINACIDNGDGTQNLTLASSLAGALDRVEFLETVRLDSDAVSVRWNGYDFESTLTAMVVQQ